MKCEACGKVAIGGEELCLDCKIENNNYHGQLEALEVKGHTHHCAVRIVMGDGVCECGIDKTVVYEVKDIVVKILHDPEKDPLAAIREKVPVGWKLIRLIDRKEDFETNGLICRIRIGELPKMKLDLKVSATKRFGFEMAHRLDKSYAEECQHVHGHSYKLEVTVTGMLNDMGMVMDFKLLDEIVEPIVKEFDHTELTSCTFGGINPTAENLASYLFKEIHKKTSLITKIVLWETEKCFVEISY